MEKTNRGFDLYQFKDRNGVPCSLQKSSIATEDCIWLGMEEPEVREFFPIPRDTDEAWFDVPLEGIQTLKKRPQNEIHLFSRMHLTQDQVRDLLPYLLSFAYSGELQHQPTKEDK